MKQAFYLSINGQSVDRLVRLFSFKEDLIVLHSAKQMEDHGSYSFICFDAFATFITKNDQCYWNQQQLKINNPFDFIKEKIKEYAMQPVPELPPLQGGVLGYFAYEAAHYLENLPQLPDSIQLPDIFLKFYDTVIAIDHRANKTWIIATGFPEKKEALREKKALACIQSLKKIIEQPNTPQQNQLPHAWCQTPIRSNFTPETYAHAVLKMKDYILKGDIFEANLSQRFQTTWSSNINPLDLYFRLMQYNPAPYGAFLRISDNQSIISASPERFIRLNNRVAETYPIKGTAKRSADQKLDDFFASELCASEKDRAEHMMIVDLMRNDLSKVCQAKSVKVDELCVLKSFQTVHHLVSKISAVLRDESEAMDLMKAAFPPGSVTGAPKIRSMELISELEGQARGPYCGCIGYLSYTGEMDSSVVIRSYWISQGMLFFSAGGAIVLDSDPEAEYHETLTKAQALIETLMT